MNLFVADADLFAMVEASAQSFLEANYSLDCLRKTDSQSDIWRKLAETGLLKLGLPENLGGAGFGAQGHVRVATLFGRELFSGPFITQSVLPCFIANHVDASEFKEAITAFLCDDTRRVSTALMETDSTFDTSQTSATLQDGGLHGNKTFVSLPADAFIVSARDNEKLVLALIEKPNDQNISDVIQNFFGQKIGNLSLHGESLTYAPIRSEGLAQLIQSALDLGTLIVSAQLSGISQKALEITLEYLRTRKQFGQTIGSFQAVQHRAVDLYIAQKLTENSVNRAAELFDSDPLSVDTQKAVSCAKVRASQTAFLMTKESIQLHGGIGFTDEADIGLYARASLNLVNQFGLPIHHQRRVYDIERARRGK